MQEIRLFPPMVVKLASVAAIVVAMVMVSRILFLRESLTQTGWFIFVCGALLFFGVGIDGIQRRYVLSGGRLDVRIMFFWLHHDLTSIEDIRTDRWGRLVLERKGSRTLRIPREYNPEGRLERNVRELLGRG